MMSFILLFQFRIGNNCNTPLYICLDITNTNNTDSQKRLMKDIFNTMTIHSNIVPTVLIPYGETAEKLVYGETNRTVLFDKIERINFLQGKSSFRHCKAMLDLIVDIKKTLLVITNKNISSSIPELKEILDFEYNVFVTGSKKNWAII